MGFLAVLEGLLDNYDFVMREVVQFVDGPVDLFVGSINLALNWSLFVWDLHAGKCLCKSRIR
jgi:hypothetical protein